MIEIADRLCNNVVQVILFPVVELDAKRILKSPPKFSTAQKMAGTNVSSIFYRFAHIERSASLLNLTCGKVI